MPLDDIYILVGFADPIGANEGFLVPLFAKAGGNSRKIALADANGRISGWEEFEPEGMALLPATEIVSVATGAPVPWAFGLANEGVLQGRGTIGKAELRAMLAKGRLHQKPFLAIEVAEFLEAHDERERAACQIFTRLSDYARDQAFVWRDLTILTKDVRELIRKKASAEPGAAWAQFDLNEIVVRARDNIVSLYGIDIRGAEIARLELLPAIRHVIRGLSKLYDDMGKSLKFKINHVARKNRFDLHRMRMSRRVIISSLADLSISDYIVKDFDIPVVDIRDLADPEVSTFLRAFDNRLYIIYDRQEPSPLLSLVTALVGEKVVALAVSPRARASWEPGHDVEFRAGGGTINIFPPAALAASSASAKRLAREIQAAIVLRDAMGQHFSDEAEEVFFFSARGSAPNFAADAWIQLYGRVGKLPLRTIGGVRAGRSDETVLEQTAPQLGRDALFPTLQDVDATELAQVFEQLRVDAAVLISGRSQARADAELGFVKVARTVVENLGWRLIGDNPAAVGAEGGTLIGSVLQTKVRIRWSGKRTLEEESESSPRRLDNGTGLCVASEATPIAIVRHFGRTGELLLNLRDFAAVSIDARSLWCFVLSQLRRNSTSLMSKSRTNYYRWLTMLALEEGSPGILWKELSQIMNSSLEDIRIVCTGVRFDGKNGFANFRILGANEARETRELANYSIRLEDGAIFVTSG